MDKAVFSFNDKQLAKLNDFHQKETQVLNHLLETLKGEDKTAMLAAAKAVKVNYSQYYKMFGDFKSVMK